MHGEATIGARSLRIIRDVGMVMAAAANMWCSAQEEQSCLPDVKRVEVPHLLWREGADLGGGEFFSNGDSLLFERDCDVLIFDHVRSEMIEVADGVTVTMTPTGGGVSVGEFFLNGTLVFYAPWVTIMDWNIVAGEHALIVMDLSTFPAHELNEALPGEYHGAIELRSGCLTATRGRGAEKLNFSQLRVKNGAQFGLMNGASYTGDVVLSGLGWLNEGEAHAQGALLMEGADGHEAVLSGRLTLADDTSINVWRAGDTGRITSELHAMGHAIIKEGAGELRLEGAVVSGPGRIEAHDGRIVMLHGWNSRGSSLALAGPGVVELHGQISNIGDWQMLEARAELVDALLDAKQLEGSGSLLLQSSHVFLDALHDFEGEMVLRNSSLHARVGEQVHLHHLDVDAMSSLCVELCQGSANIPFCVEQLHFSGGSQFELSLSLCHDMLSDARSVGHGVVEGALQFEENCVLALHIVSMDDDIEHAYGKYLEFVLAEHVEGMPQLDSATQALLEKYFGKTAALRKDDGRLVLSGNFITPESEVFHRQAAKSFNGRAGASLLDATFVELNPQVNAPEGDLAAILRSQEFLISNGHKTDSDSLSSAVAGAAIPALVLALREQARINLLSLPASMSDSCAGTTWNIHGTGSYAHCNSAGTDSGYQLMMWGGSCGWQTCNARTIFGCRLLANYGNWQADSADAARADLSLYDLGAYYRVRSNAWVHTLAAQCGVAEAHVIRNVSAPGVSYKTAGRTRGFTCGASYETAYAIPRAAPATGELQIFLHCAALYAAWGGYCESGSDAALRVGRQHLPCVEIGPGLRRSGAGSLFESHCRWQLSAMFVGDMGPTQARVRTGFIHGSSLRETIRSRAMSPFGVLTSAAVNVNAGMGELELRLIAELRQHGGSASMSIGYSQRF